MIVPTIIAACGMKNLDLCNDALPSNRYFVAPRHEEQEDQANDERRLN
jgi:hypothetical protein